MARCVCVRRYTFGGCPAHKNDININNNKHLDSFFLNPHMVHDRDDCYLPAVHGVCTHVL